MGAGGFGRRGRPCHAAPDARLLQPGKALGCGRAGGRKALTTGDTGGKNIVNCKCSSWAPGVAAGRKSCGCRKGHRGSSALRGKKVLPQKSIPVSPVVFS